MQKILPRGAAPQVQPVRDVAISLARNEKESFQVLVLPREQPINNVHLRVSDLRERAGTCWPPRISRLCPSDMSRPSRSRRTVRHTSDGGPIRSSTFSTVPTSRLVTCRRSGSAFAPPK